MNPPLRNPAYAAAINMFFTNSFRLGEEGEFGAGTLVSVDEWKVLMLDQQAERDQSASQEDTTQPQYLHITHNNNENNNNNYY